MTKVHLVRFDGTDRYLAIGGTLTQNPTHYSIHWYDKQKNTSIVRFYPKVDWYIQ